MIIVPETKAVELLKIVKELPVWECSWSVGKVSQLRIESDVLLKMISSLSLNHQNIFQYLRQHSYFSFVLRLKARSCVVGCLFFFPLLQAFW